MTQHRKVKQLSVKIFAVISFALLANQFIFAEVLNTSPERGFSPGKSYAISDIETVGLFSGNLMLNVPLGSLPSGRGGISGGVNLRYDSKIWDVFHSYFEHFTTTHEMTTLGASQEGGWQYGYKYRLKLNSLVLDLDQAYCTGANPFPYSQKLQLVMPDGSQHELVLSDTTYVNGDGLMNIYPDGNRVCSAHSSPQPITGNVTFFTTDGSYLRLDVIHDSDTNWENNTWILYSPDGTRVIYNQRDGLGNVIAAQRIIDRNDNYVDVIENTTDSSYSNHRTTYLKDQLGRKVVIEYEADENETEGWTEDSIHSEGFNGADISTKVRWKYITINKSYQTADVDGYRNSAFNVPLRIVEKVFLPSQVSGNLFYEFGYNVDTTSATDVGWGEVNKVILPSEAYASYSYSTDNVSGSGVLPEVIADTRAVQKQLHYDSEYDGATTAVTDTWSYALSGSTVTVTAPDGGTTVEDYSAASIFTPPALPDSGSGEASKITGSDGTVIEKIHKSNLPTAVFQNNVEFNLRSANRYVKYEFVSPKDASGNYTKTAIKEYSRDKNGNVTEVKEYDYVAYSTIPRNSLGKPSGLPSGATPARITKTEYYNDTPDASSTTYTDAESYHLATSPRVRNAVKSAEVQNGSGTPKSRSEMFYDNASTTGNLTETKAWDSYKNNSTQAYSNPLVSTNSISTSITYNSYGSPTLITDAKGNQTQITYGTINGYSGLYPTQTISAYGTSIARTSNATYDFDTGLAMTATDADNNVTNATEYDDLGRPTKVAAANGTALEIWTQTEYDDVNRKVIVRSDLETKGDAKKVSTQFYDQLGRVRLSKTLEDSATQSATNETDGIKVQTRYTYDDPTPSNPDDSQNSLGTYSIVSNPYRAATSNAATNEQSMGWTRTKTINTGKHSEIETFSGASLPAPWGSNSSSTGVVKTDIDLDRTLVTDQVGKQRISKTSVLGWLTDVWEVTGSDSATDSITFPGQTLSAGYKTSYAYDLLNNMTTVTQGSQTRSFSYSSLSRLLSAANPESGTINYQYDPNGNLTRKTDARSITTDYTYDALNRVTFRNYSGSTPDVTYTYDNLTNGRGKLTKMESSVSTTESTSFDLLGRTTGYKQTSDGTAYTTAYKYNLSGALIEETYPSGRVVKNSLDPSGDLARVQSKKIANAPFWNYAQNFTYTPAGAVSSMELGNTRWESTQFNSRLQPTQIALGTSQNATNLLDLDYSYGTTQNNGNIQSQTITVPTTGGVTGFTATQTYTYDNLNRIKDAAETISGSQTWKQTFTYDRYGNRSLNEGGSSGNYLTTTLTRNCTTSTYNPNGICDKKGVNPTFTSANRIVQDQDNDSVNDYLFDSSGNTTRDAQGNIYTYDAENQQIEVKNSSNQTIGQYWYDCDRKRVKKIAGNEVTIFVYDAAGKLVAEYSTQISQTPQVSYLTNDHLGSQRIITDKDGKVFSRRDFLPFGEELNSTHTPQRNINLNYGQDAIRQKFTSYERDNETDLDFAQARMYGSKLGRFTAVDPGPFDPLNPQVMNRYVYTINNPLKYMDPDGRKIRLTGTAEEIEEARIYLQNTSGFKLEVDKKGNVTVVGTIESKTALKDFATELKTILDDKKTATYNIVSEVEGIIVDDGFDASDKNRPQNIDINDIRQIGKDAPELGAALTIHALREGLELAKGNKYNAVVQMLPNGGMREESPSAHDIALAAENRVMSGISGTTQERGRAPVIADKKTATYDFKYTTVTYTVSLVVRGSEKDALTVTKTKN
jgi:RHS repeat-associated protein